MHAQHVLCGNFAMASSSVNTSDASEAGSSSVSSHDTVPSLLSRLRAPSHSELMRKRKVRTNQPPHTGMRRKKPACSTDPKSVSVAQRVKEFSGEMLRDSAGKLFCSACREELSLKLSIIKYHVESAKHARHKHQLKEKGSHELDITQAFREYEQEVHPVGESLPEAHKLWRVKVVTTFLRSGVPLAKIVQFWGLLEEHAYSLSDRRGMSDLVPFIQSQEQQQIKSELQSKKVCVIFDGTTRLGEALVIVLRFVDGFVIKQRLVRFLTLTKSLTGEEIARELINVLSVEYGITSERVLASMRDRASVNRVAMQTTKVVYPDMMIICITGAALVNSPTTLQYYVHSCDIKSIPFLFSLLEIVVIVSWIPIYHFVIYPFFHNCVPSMLKRIGMGDFPHRLVTALQIRVLFRIQLRL